MGQTGMNGQIYDMKDPITAKEKIRAVLLCEKLNALSITQKEERTAIVEELFGGIGEGWTIYPGFHCDNGKNITIGRHAFINYNVSIMDRGRVTIGDHILLAPNVVITTSNHPLDLQMRRDSLGFASPVTIGNDVWIGANAVILPGVTIGNNVVVAAGAVVTKDIPDNMLVAGVPAHPIRTLERKE